MSEYKLVTNGGETVTRKRKQTGFAIDIDGVQHKPVVVTEVEIENDGSMATPQDQCGNMQRSRVGTTGWMISVKGLVTDNEDRFGNLSMQMLRDVIANASEVSAYANVIPESVGEAGIEVSNVVITDAAEAVSIETPDTDGEETVYSFQLQLGEDESSS